MLHILKFDLLGITETHLNKNISDDWIKIPGYNFIRNDRDSLGVGVLIYFKEDLISHQIHSWDKPNMEATRLNVTVRSQSFLIGCIYRPPNDTSFFETFTDTITNIWMMRKNIILVGDFNSDMLHKPNNAESNCGTRLKRILHSFGLKNVIRSPIA